jgi:hypothetical protein
MHLGWEVLDIVPTIEHFERTNMQFALGYYHWFWLAQPHPFPGVLIEAAGATEVSGGAVESGHFIPEEAPGAVLNWFGRFFG